MKVRRAVPGDIPRILELVTKFHDRLQPRYPFTSTFVAIQEERSFVWVAEDKDKLVGYIWAYPLSQHVLFAPQAFSERKGGFQSLIEFAVEDSVRLGYRGVVTVIIREGLEVFRRVGFVPTGVVMEMAFPPRSVVLPPDLDKTSG